jgi:hypothetical protein
MTNLKTEFQDAFLIATEPVNCLMKHGVKVRFPQTGKCFNKNNSNSNDGGGGGGGSSIYLASATLY